MCRLPERFQISIDFELPDNLGELSRLGKLGIDGMQTRARLVGGTFDMHSESDKGTILTIAIPAKAH